MNVDPACFPCALGRVLCTARHITDDAWLHHKILAKAMTELAEAGKDLTPAELVFPLQETIGKTLGSADPYHQQREEWHEELQNLLPSLLENLAGSEDPVLDAIAISALGNVFDDECLSVGKIRSILRDSVSAGAPLAHSDDDLFRQELAGATSLLFLHDSAPELLFDRVLIERLVSERPELEVTCVVRSAPVLLDAAAEDASVYELGDVQGVKAVIDPGIAALGTPLNECSREFRERFDEADIVLAKGQAHYETLEDAGRHVFHAMRVKCDVVGRKCGVPVGDTVFLRS